MNQASKNRATACPVLFVRVGWLDHYDSELDGEVHPIGGGSFNREERGSEVENFHEIDGLYYGYAQPPGKAGKPLGLNVARLGASATASEAEDILVIFVAKRESAPGQVIVGWYDHATCLAGYRARAARDDDVYGFYNIVADVDDAHLRKPLAKRLGRGCFGAVGGPVDRAHGRA